MEKDERVFFEKLLRQKGEMLNSFADREANRAAVGVTGEDLSPIKLKLIDQMQKLEQLLNEEYPDEK